MSDKRDTMIKVDQDVENIQPGGEAVGVKIEQNSGHVTIEVPSNPKPPSPVPPITLEPIPPLPKFIARKDQLERLGQKLEQQRFLILQAIAGMGLNTVGSKLARDRTDEENIFWFTFDQNQKNRVETFFWAIAEFLRQHQQPALWKLLEEGRDTDPPLSDETILAQLLKELEQKSYVIVINDFHEVMDTSAAKSMFDLLKRRFDDHWQDLPAPLMVMGRQIPDYLAYLGTDVLEGLSTLDTLNYLEEQGLQLVGEKRGVLWELTGGNPKLLLMAARNLRPTLNQPEKFDQTLDALINQGGAIYEYIKEEIYNLLSDPEKQLVLTLSIFPQKVGLEVLEAMLAEQPPLNLRETLDGLAHKSMLQGQNGQILCVNPLRDFAYREQTPSDRKVLHIAAAGYFQGSKDYLSASHHLLAAKEPERAADLLVKCDYALINQRQSEELLEQLEQLDSLTSEKIGAGRWVMMRQAKGETYNFRGEYAKALAAYRQALEQNDEKPREAKLQELMGTTLVSMDMVDKAEEHYLESLFLRGLLNDRVGMSEAHIGLGWMHYRLLDLDKARRHFYYAESIADEVGNKGLLARIWQGQGTVELFDERLNRAEDLLRKARVVFENSGDRRRQAQTSGNLAILYGKQGQPERQLEQYQEVLRIHQELGDSAGQEITHNNLGIWYLNAAQPEKALEHYQRLLESASSNDRTRMEVFAQVGLADANLMLNHPPAALAQAQEAHRLAQTLPEESSRLERGVALRVLGQVSLVRGEVGVAKDYLNQAMDLLKDLDEEDYNKAKQSLESVQDVAAKT